MRQGKTRAALVIGCLGCAIPALGQAPRDSSAAGADSAAAPPAQRKPPAETSVQVVREIDDPHTGDRWLLVRDWDRPGGPGRLVLLPGAVRSQGSAIADPRIEPIPAQPSSRDRLAGPLAPPVIRPGDRLVVEEDTPVVEARLSAVAITAAAPGGPLQARLEIGGKVVQALALGPGRARLAPQSGGKP